uniref:Uncharacterized protein n=1 Tax=Arundo donax TaxID=35708 RepID=A0A0A9G6F0_ARUDO
MPSLPLWSSSETMNEVNENNNNAKIAKGIGYVTEMSEESEEEPPDNTEPAEEQDGYLKYNSTGGATTEKGVRTQEDGRPDKQPFQVEPLSRVARKVFELL